MKCKHGQPICACNDCMSKVLAHLVKQEKVLSSCSLELINKPCRKCYANAFIMTPGSSGPRLIRTFTEAEITAPDACIMIPLTSSCDGLALQLGKCKSPDFKWCKYIDRENDFVTSVQVPKGCQGCYNFDLSASVALTATFNLVLEIIGAIGFTVTSNISLPSTVELKLCEQLPRHVCVVDSIADTPERCFTAELFPIIDTPCATESIVNTNLIPLLTLLPLTIPGFFSGSDAALALLQGLSQLSGAPEFINLAVSGTVCLKECQRLVPCLTIRDLNIDLDAITTTILGFISQIQGASGSFVSPTLTNIQLSLSCLSLKLVKIGDCCEDCQCKSFSS